VTRKECPNVLKDIVERLNPNVFIEFLGALHAPASQNAWAALGSPRSPTGQMDAPALLQ
jgi:hypothetical protein